MIYVLALSFLGMSILFSKYSAILQVSCFLTGIGLFIKGLTSKDNVLK